MSPRLTAQRRLDVGLQAIGLAFERDGIPVADAAQKIGVDAGTVEDAVQPFTDLEYVHSSGQLLDDIGHVVTMHNDMIEVQQNWMQDLKALTPGDAALLLAMIESAGEIEGISIEALRGLRRRLDAIAHLQVLNAVPATVADLIHAKHAGTVISARYESSDMRVADDPALYEVHEVHWTDSGWRVLVSPYGEPDTGAVNLAAEKLHDISATSHKFERRSLALSGDRSEPDTEVVEIEYPQDKAWLLNYFNPTVISEDEGKTVARIRIDPERTLRRLMLRLGPGARIIAPDYLTSVGQNTARRLLSMYDADGRT